MFRRIQQDLLIPKPQFTLAQSGTQQPPPNHMKIAFRKPGPLGIILESFAMNLYI